MANALFGANWSLVQNSSTYSLAGSKPTNERRRYEEVPGGYSLTVTGTRKSVPYEWSYTALYDGKDHVVRGRPDVDAIEAYRVNDSITIGFFKKNGIEVAAYKRQVALNGDVLSVTASGIGEGGTPYFDVIQYKK